MTAPSSIDLSGLWHGRYFYPIQRSPVPFTATITDSAGWLTGVIEETGTAGDARGVMLSAALQGRRTGHSVTWLKLYDGAYRLYDAVRYEGDVNEDGTEIGGRWSIHGNWSGTFLMLRPAGIGETAQTKVSERA